ncbi:hypothetical protein VM1G_02572 [Cytospora mali]|uniref:ATP-grasp domain-containing protein n=1 Tax=Cytospora mali TaxID=578113 RepID=A0A194VSG7_CYTMA|nr:hypothetical protein VM1G_02572 [Valsa mali]
MKAEQVGVMLPDDAITLQPTAQQTQPRVAPTDPKATSGIRLDTTLADLYRTNGIPGPFIVTMYCVFGHLDLHPAWPRELVYPEDEEPVPYSDDGKEIARLQKVILGMKPLRRAFGLGNIDVIFFGPNVNQKAMERALSQLEPDQRHRPAIIDLDQGDVHEQIKAVTNGKKLLFWRPQGWMDNHDCLLDPREMYDINSKKYLVTSGMHTPPSDIVDLQAVELTDESTCIFWTRPLPFVVKLYRAGCSFGTYIVKTEDQRQEMMVAMAKYKARGVGEVLVSKCIDLVQDLSVHFVVGAPGTTHDREDPLILGVTVQKLTAKGKWVGGHIDYSMQEELRRHVWDTVQDTTRRLPETFMGWAGVDIVVDRDGGQWVVDLNARFTGSMPICFMSGHFWKERSLPLAQFATFEYGGEVDSIYDRLEILMQTGHVIVTATAEIEEGVNMADVVWGGKDVDDLAEVEKWVREVLAKA